MNRLHTDKKGGRRLNAPVLSCASIILSFVLIIACFNVPALAAGSPDKSEVKAELDATAQAMLGYMKDAVKDTSNSYYYNHYKNYALTAKAGKTDKAVETALLDYLKTKTNADGTTLITGTYSDEVWYAYIILFLNETGQNPKDYEGVNYVSLLEKYYLNADNYINPYIEQYVMSYLYLFDNAEAVKTKLQKTADGYYMDDPSGYGIGMKVFDDYTYEGVEYKANVTADDNGQCLITLNTLTGSDIPAKITAALDWTATLLNEYSYANSYALALKAFAEYDDFDRAADTYNTLIGMQSTTKGVYLSWEGKDDYTSATPDALLGLLAYYRALDGKSTFETVKSEADNNQPTQDNENQETEPTEQTETQSGSQNEPSEDNTTQQTPDNTDNNPPTGDFTNVAVLTAVLLLSGICCIHYNKKQLN